MGRDRLGISRGGTLVGVADTGGRKGCDFVHWDVRRLSFTYLSHVPHNGLTTRMFATFASSMFSFELCGVLPCSSRIGCRA